MTSSPDKAKTPTADESAWILIDHLKRREPFFFIRYGDGALECIYEFAPGLPTEKSRTCDGELYSRELSLSLLDAWARLETAETTVFAGDWQSASFGGKSGNNPELDKWTALTFGVPFRFIHFETLLLMRNTDALVEFYRTVRADKRRKVYVGPHEAAARFLVARHVKTPMIPDLIRYTATLVEEIESEPFDVCLYGAGMAGNVAAVESWSLDRSRTYISLGSALDPLFGRPSRSQQLSRRVLLAMFRGML